MESSDDSDLTLLDDSESLGFADMAIIEWIAETVKYLATLDQ